MINDIVRVLNSGGLVVHPSDTVYGLLCDATNPDAVKKLFAFKERQAGKAVSVFVSDLVMAKKYVVLDEKIENRLKKFLPGPYTVILPSRHSVVKGLESENGTLGIRIPKHPVLLDLLKKFGKPLTATSANRSSRSPHYSIGSLKKQISKKKMELIDLVVDGGELPHNKPSTVIDFTTDDLKVLRMGGQNILSSRIYVSRSEKETKNIAKKLLKQELASGTEKPVVFILKGDLGAGKTVFAKGLGEALGIKNIISPTHVIYYEYQGTKTFVHVDLYNVSSKEEFEHLGLEKYFDKEVAMCIEWGEKSGEIIDEIKQKTKTVYVSIEHQNEHERKIIISE